MEEGKRKMKFDKVLKEEYEYSDFAVTKTVDVIGLQKPIKGKNGKDKIVRRVIKNPVTYIGGIKL